jgi:hypothetical protein
MIGIDYRPVEMDFFGFACPSVERLPVGSQCGFEPAEMAPHKP